MLFSGSKRSIFPLLPPYGAHDPSSGQIIPLHADGLTPYLGLRARLSQVWINRWTVLLILVLVRLLIAIGSVQSDMASAKREALSACTSVEDMGSAMASMPHYLSQGVNELTAKGIDEAVSGLTTMLTLVITGVEELILFVIKVMYQTYLCLITMAVRGTVEVAIEGIEAVTDALNSTIKSTVKDIESTVSTFETALNKAIDVVNTLGVDIPSLDLNSSLSELENIQISSSFDDKLNALNSSIPTFDEVENITETVIRYPFEAVKTLVKNELGNYSFDQSAFPVPGKKQLTFCDDNDGINSFFSEITDIAITARKIFIIVIIIAAVLVCVPVAWQEVRRWRHMQERAQLVRKEAHDPMDVVYIVSRPYTAAAGIKAASRFSNSRRQILVRWVIAYATSLPALLVLGLALAALLSCLCQYLLLHSIKKEVPALSAEVGEFADKVVGALQNASVEWANGANKAITSFDDDLNDNLFGWVNTSTTAVNNTINTFVDKTTGVINDTFYGTVLEKPIMELFDCIVLLKAESVQKGLTWVHNHAHIDFPLLPNDTFSRGAAASISNDTSGSDSFLANAGDETSDKITEVVSQVINKLENALKTEALIATAILLIWVLIVLIGIARALTLFWRQDRNRGEGGGHAMDSVSHPPAPVSGSRGFTDVPLNAIPKNELGSIHAVPQYEIPAESTMRVRGDISCADEKLGFAGQRDYESAVQVESAPAARKSNYVEYDTKKV
ncbi:Plasma membrane fusion protein prm1 [Penicillium macrosclerotiorum]|uniref:Plasma membrane fusion protein prm1 n=1 Tax=Penicillium macrosclerotiorum TaxID=303699 RepID=UPI0025478A75|nr:Plasma membrane fusion protein prm1 [Penicillium macrosclerotiorum]KAJ5679314.1 Plasma membrane fusion protein prm1 [Penicillium macrosclerotiorum]